MEIDRFIKGWKLNEWYGESFADGAGGVDDVENSVAIEAGEFLVADGLGLVAFFTGVGAEQGLDGSD